VKCALTCAVTDDLVAQWLYTELLIEGPPNSNRFYLTTENELNTGWNFVVFKALESFYVKSTSGVRFYNLLD